MSWMISDYLVDEHRKVLLALSYRARRDIETLAREALTMYLAAKEADSLGACPRNKLLGLSGHRCWTGDVRR